jgi:hypothetical protein
MLLFIFYVNDERFICYDCYINVYSMFIEIYRSRLRSRGQGQFDLNSQCQIFFKFLWVRVIQVTKKFNSDGRYFYRCINFIKSHRFIEGEKTNIVYFTFMIINNWNNLNISWSDPLSGVPLFSDPIFRTLYNIDVI